ncbi:MAG: hypothetical protein ACI959_000390 [Limisphaerales bacterium]|jgi:hypothetical protein
MLRRIAKILLFFTLAMCTPALGQGNVHFGLHGSYTINWPHFEQRDLVSSVNLFPSQSASGGLDISFFISEQASIGTGFRLRSQYIRASANDPNDPSQRITSSDKFPLIELPLKFAIRQHVRGRFSVKQEFAIEIVITGSSVIDSIPFNPNRSFTAIASPDRNFNVSLMAGAGVEYRSKTGFRFDLIAEYHQGVGNTIEVGRFEFQSPDQSFVLPVISDLSYFSIRLGVSIPADKFSDLAHFIF